MKRVWLYAFFAVPALASAALWVEKPVVAVIGDSYTRRTICSNYSTYDSCDLAGQVKHELSYSTYLNVSTKYQVVVTDNAGRGGDTCTVQAAYTNGPWINQARGIVAQIDARITSRPSEVVSILIGINDMNLYNVSEASLKSCLRTLYAGVVASNRKVVAMTYPPTTTTTNVWSPMSGATASANVAKVNNAIRAAVAEHNLAYPSGSRVLLAETANAWTAVEAGTFTEDGAHPNQAGAMRIARKWYTEVCSKGYVACY